jgi:hypothetical protein
MVYIPTSPTCAVPHLEKEVGSPWETLDPILEGRYTTAKHSQAYLPVPPPHILKMLSTAELEILENYYTGPIKPAVSESSDGDKFDLTVEDVGTQSIFLTTCIEDIDSNSEDNRPLQCLHKEV